MKLPFKTARPATSDDLSAPVASEYSSADEQPSTGKPTPGKGRPTPKRRDSEKRRRGPVAPPPMTRSEAKARKRSLQGPPLTKEQKKAAAAQRRADANARREAMANGDERYLLPRDKGPVKAMVRDIVDSRRNLAGLFLPFAVVLILCIFLLARYAVYVQYLMYGSFLLMVADGVWLGRIIVKKVRAKYPDAPNSALSMGWYGFTRATQLRKMRTPRPRVDPGAAV